MENTTLNSNQFVILPKKKKWRITTKVWDTCLCCNQKIYE